MTDAALDVHRDGAILRLTLDRAAQAQRARRRDHRRAHRRVGARQPGRDRPRRRAHRPRGRLLRRLRPGHPNVGCVDPAAGGQHPAAAPDAGPPAAHPGVHHPGPRSSRPCGGGPPGSACTWPSRRTSASPPPTPASGSRSRHGASPPTAAARGCCPAASGWPAPRSCCCSAGSSRGPTRRPGVSSTSAVDPGDLDARAEALTAGLASGPTVALGLTKWLVHTGAGLDLERHLANEALALELSSRTADFREGLTALAERRDPGFEGR